MVPLSEFLGACHGQNLVLVLCADLHSQRIALVCFVTLDISLSLVWLYLWRPCVVQGHTANQQKGGMGTQISVCISKSQVPPAPQVPPWPPCFPGQACTSSVRPWYSEIVEEQSPMCPPLSFPEEILQTAQATGGETQGPSPEHGSLASKLGAGTHGTYI